MQVAAIKGDKFEDYFLVDISDIFLNVTDQR